MSGRPFVLHVAKPSNAPRATLVRDLLTTEDPLPAALEIGAGAYMRLRKTRVTDVRRETTDDN